ncbi:glutamate--tRNA ligase [Patescibacteria group bacterium]
MSQSQEKIITRFAPSPTGFLHIGSARTALFNFLYARKHGGEFLLRIEDTDKERSTKEFEEDILNGLKSLGIDWDNENKIVRQSERGDVYKKYLEKMIGDGSAYEAEENADGTGKVIRFKNPNEKVKFNDLIRGDIEFDTTELKDFVIAKDMDSPLYHLAVVVDDFEMGVTHVIRGEDGISNTPRQILIQRAIGAPEPKYAHIPLILATDKSKLSKRHGAVSVSEYINQGYLPEALVNFLAMIGWNPGDDREFFSMEELIEEFTLEKVQKGGAVFNQDKLNWTNKQYLANTPEDITEQTIKKYLPEIPSDILKKITPIIMERISKWSDIEEMKREGEFDYYTNAQEINPEKLVWKTDSLEQAKTHLKKVAELLEDADFTSPDTIKETIWDYAEKEGRGNVLWPMRMALSGRDKSPDPFTLAYILGKEEAVKRLESVS